MGVTPQQCCLMLPLLLQLVVIDDGRVVCGKRLCNARVSVRLSVCTSVCLSCRAAAAAAPGGFAAERERLQQIDS